MMKMVTRILTTICTLRNALTLSPTNARIFLHSFPKIVRNPPKILLITAANTAANSTRKDFSSDDIKNIDVKLMEASQKGKNSLIKLMDFLKMKFVEVGQAYTESLEKQIKAINEAGRFGASSKKWDELPHYRTLTNDVKQQYHDLVVAIKTIRQSAENQAMKFIKDETHLKLIQMKCQEIEKVVDKYTKEVEKLEAELVAAVRDSIRR